MIDTSDDDLMTNRLLIMYTRIISFFFTSQEKKGGGGGGGGGGDHRLPSTFQIIVRMRNIYASQAKCGEMISPLVIFKWLKGLERLFCSSNRDRPF